MPQLESGKFSLPTLPFPCDVSINLNVKYRKQICGEITLMALLCWRSERHDISQSSRQYRHKRGVRAFSLNGRKNERRTFREVKEDVQNGVLHANVGQPHFVQYLSMSRTCPICVQLLSSSCQTHVLVHLLSRFCLTNPTIVQLISSFCPQGQTQIQILS